MKEIILKKSSYKTPQSKFWNFKYRDHQELVMKVILTFANEMDSVNPELKPEYLKITSDNDVPGCVDEYGAYGPCTVHEYSLSLATEICENNRLTVKTRNDNQGYTDKWTGIQTILDAAYDMDFAKERLLLIKEEMETV